MRAHLNGAGGLYLPNNGDAVWEDTQASLELQTLLFRYVVTIRSWREFDRPPNERFYRLRRVKVGVPW